MKILKSILNYIPLATFIIFVVTDGIISLTSALIFVISTIGLLINWKRKNQRWRIKKIPIYQLQVTLKESAHSRCWLFKNYILINCTTTYKKICSTLWKNVYKCIKVSKSNNYKDLCIRHTFVKGSLKKHMNIKIILTYKPQRFTMVSVS